MKQALSNHQTTCRPRTVALYAIAGGRVSFGTGSGGAV